jgi:parallel beta-helix repeat protein
LAGRAGSAYDNEFRNQRYTGCTSGILYNSRTIMAEDGQGVVADGNLFNGTAQSILVTGSIDQNPATSITNNIFASNSAGPFLGRPRDVIIRGNTFEGTGIYLDSSTDTVIENNRFTGASYAVYAAGTHTGVEFRDNAVLGKYASSAGSPWAGRTLFNTGANPINAANNWWGQAEGPTITTPPTPDVIHQNPGSMPYRPWIASHVNDTNPTAPYTTGFWPTSTITGNQLTGIVLSTSGTLTPSFTPETLSYTSNAGEASTITVTPSIVAGSGATITVNGTPVTSGSRTAPINLRTGVNTVTVVVSNGTQPSSTYVFTVDRSATPTFATVAPVTVPPTTSATRPAGPNQPGFNVASIRAEDVANIAPSQLRTIQPAQMNRLTPEAVAALNPAQVAAIPPAALTGLRPLQVAAMPVEAVAALRPAQFTAISPSAVASLQPQQLAAVPVAAINAMRPAQLAAIPPTTFAAMTPRQVGTFSAAQARSVSPEQAAVLTPRQLRSLPAAIRRILQNLAAEADGNS